MAADPDTTDPTSADTTPRTDPASGAGTAPIREVLGWGQFGDASRELAQLVRDSGFEAEIVLAIARGGLVPAGALAYALGLKAAGTLNVEFYTDIEETLPDPVVLEPFLDTNAIVGKKLLVVDDVADSGRTLALVMDLVRGHGADARSAVLYTKPRTILQPDYSWRETDRWITFPWSAQPPVTQSAQPPVTQSAQPPVTQSAQPPVTQSAQPPVTQSGPATC